MILSYAMAGFTALTIALSGTALVYKWEYEKERDYRIYAEHQAKEADKRNKYIEKRSNLVIKDINERYKEKITTLTNTIDRVREQSRVSILSKVPRSTDKADRVCFNRDTLDRSLQEYRDRIVKLIGEGSYYQLDRNTWESWYSHQSSIYGKD